MSLHDDDVPRVDPRKSFDAGTGYRPALADFLAEAKQVCSEDGIPKKSGEAVLPGLYFCGFHVTPTGMLREIAIEARRIGRAVGRERSRSAGARIARE